MMSTHVFIVISLGMLAGCWGKLWKGEPIYPQAPDVFIPQITKVVKRALKQLGRDGEVLGATYAELDGEEWSRLRYYVKYTVQDRMNPGAPVGACKIEFLVNSNASYKIIQIPLCEYMVGYKRKFDKYANDGFSAL